MTDDFVARRHAEIDAEIRLNDRQAEVALNTVSHCRHRLTELSVTVGVAVDALTKLRRGPKAGADWDIDDVAELLHDHNPAGSFAAEIARARTALDHLEDALRPWGPG